MALALLLAACKHTCMPLIRCRRENETSNSQDRHIVRPTIHSQFIYRRRVRCRPKRKHTNVILRRPRCVLILNLNEGVPRTFHSAHNLNARVLRTCFENILPGSCTENIYERAPCYLKVPIGKVDTILKCFRKTVFQLPRNRICTKIAIS